MIRMSMSADNDMNVLWFQVMLLQKFGQVLCLPWTQCVHQNVLSPIPDQGAGAVSTHVLSIFSRATVTGLKQMDRRLFHG
jgi:hypothetical protein